jgi:hypothetical protein
MHLGIISEINSDWSLVIGHWSLVIGHWSIGQLVNWSRVQNPYSWTNDKGQMTNDKIKTLLSFGRSQWSVHS